MRRSPSLNSRARSPLQAMGCALLLLAVPLHNASPAAAFWTTPCILLASVLITWGAESAQFFVAQGFALAILAWMQTLPEFAVEAVLAWHRQTTLLLANLTGALRLLTGLAWPMIYLTAAVTHRRRTGSALRKIQLERHHSVEVAGLLLPLLYAVLIWCKGSLKLYDSAVLLLFYLAYLGLLTKLPPQKVENIEDLETVPRSIVRAPRRWRILAISFCFLAGGVIIYLTAEPFLGSMEAVATAMGIPVFVVIQWFAPVVSEFPELASTFYFARKERGGALAIMNIASSNINQLTLLVAMLPLVYSISAGSTSGFTLDGQQKLELLLTIAQTFTGFVFLLNMKLSWLEATGMFCLFLSQFVLPRFFGGQAIDWITAAFLFWIAAGLVGIAVRRKLPAALTALKATWRAHVAS